MRRGVVFIILLSALLIGVLSVNNKQEVKTQVSAEQDASLNECRDTKVEFKNGEIFINDQAEKVANYWEANFYGPHWNHDCSWFAYTTGTPSSGFNVYLIKVENGEIIQVDLHDRLPDYDHVYTEFVKWISDDEVEISVYGVNTNNNDKSEKAIYRFNIIESGFTLL